MGTFFHDLWCRAQTAPGDTWQWFNELSREEWMVVLTVVCVCGFVSLLGFRRTSL